MEGRSDATHGAMAAEISNGLVQLHREYYGRGPTKAKTYFVNDTVLCILEGGFTTVEHTLLQQGQAEAVLDIRRTFQEAMKDEFTKVVEAATARTVIAYLSQIHNDPDLAVELFVLEPTDERIILEHEIKASEETEEQAGR